MSFRGQNNEVKENELYDLKKKGWLEVGTGADAGKWRLSAKGLDEFTRLTTSLPNKAQVLIALKLAANAYTTESAIKGFMQQ